MGHQQEALFRLARRDDESALLAMMEDFNRHEGIPWRLERVRGALRKLLERPAGEELGAVSIVEQASAVCGYFVITYGYDLEFAGRDAFLTELYVKPGWRGRGLGRTALAQAEKLALDAGAGALHLGVLPDDERALSLYRGADFAQSPYVFLTKRLG